MQGIVVELRIIKQYVFLGPLGQGSRRREICMLEKMQEEPKARVRNTYGNNNTSKK